MPYLYRTLEIIYDFLSIISQLLLKNKNYS